MTGRGGPGIQGDPLERRVPSTLEDRSIEGRDPGSIFSKELEKGINIY